MKPGRVVGRGVDLRGAEASGACDQHGPRAVSWQTIESR